MRLLVTEWLCKQVDRASRDRRQEEGRSTAGSRCKHISYWMPRDRGMTHLYFSFSLFIYLPGWHCCVICNVQCGNLAKDFYYAVFKVWSRRLFNDKVYHILTAGWRTAVLAVPCCCVIWLVVLGWFGCSLWYLECWAVVIQEWLLICVSRWCTFVLWLSTFSIEFSLLLCEIMFACAALGSSFILSYFVPIYLCMFVRRKRWAAVWSMT